MQTPVGVVSTKHIEDECAWNIVQSLCLFHPIGIFNDARTSMPPDVSASDPTISLQAPALDVVTPL